MGLRIVTLGAPGAGKGTQAKRLATDQGLPHISTGDIFRAHLREGTDLGKQVQSYLDAGRLVPDDVTCAIVADRLAEPDCADGYILDGFPRSVPQAEALDAVLCERGETLDVAINIDVPDDVIVGRLTARRSCPQCGRIYNLTYDPPQRDGVCDNPDCGGAALVHRKDDQVETINERLRVYHETTEPIIAYYDRQGILSNVLAADAPPPDVYKKIEEALAALESS